MLNSASSDKKSFELKRPVPSPVLVLTQLEADWLRSYPANYQNLVEGLKTGKARISDPIPVPQYERGE